MVVGAAAASERQIRYTASVLPVWTFLAIVLVAWLLWVVVCLFALEADKLEKKRPPDAGFSVLPVIPLLPLLFIGVAWLIDRFASPWGIRIIGGLHLLLIAVYLVGIIHEMRRIRSARRRVARLAGTPETCVVRRH